MLELNEDDINEISNIYLATLKKENYPQSEKVSLILNFWLKNFNVLIGSAVFPEKKILDLQSWYTYKLYNFKFKSSVAKESLKRKIINLVKIFYIPKNGILIGGLPNSPNILEKFNYILTKSILSKTKTSHNNALKDTFLKNLSQFYTKDIVIFLDKNIPDFFFLNIIRQKLPNLYKGSMTIAFQEPYNKIFFQDPPPKIIGYQHGGLYGELISNRVEELELQLSDNYYGWGLNKNNILQNRFTCFSKDKILIKNFFLPKVAPINNLIKSFFPEWNDINEEADFFLKQTRKEKIEICIINHPIEKFKTQNLKSSKFFADFSENEINNSIFIFDRPGHTLMYKCIYQDIPFIFIYKKEWLRFLKPNFIDFS
jgi:hypothetical protein